MLNMFWNFTLFLITVSILITVHEFGHFLVARCCGVKVERFAVGFGKILWKYVDRYGTEFVISLIPIGGYTKMFDKNTKRSDCKIYYQSFNHKKISQRICIVSAGPIANFIFSIFIYSLIFVIGIPTIRPIIGKIQSHSIAENAKIMPNMEIKAIDGINTPDWDSVKLELSRKIGNNSTVISIAPFNSNQYENKILDLRHWTFNSDENLISSLGIYPKNIQIDTTLAEVKKGSAANKAGLQAGDKIIKVNGHLLTQWITFANLVHNSPKKPLTLEVKRKDNLLSFILIPEVIKEGIITKKIKGFAGVVPKVLSYPGEYKTIRQYQFFDAIFMALDKTWQLLKLTVQMLGKLIVGDVKLNHLNGPLSIAQKAGISAKFGFVHYLMFLALISINLGTVNLFPLPVLDGGHLLFLIIEKLQGKPVSEKIQNLSHRIGLVLIIFFMGISLFNDFSQL